MAETGVLTEEDRVELLEGWITPKTTRTPRHDAIVHYLYEMLTARMPAGWEIRNQGAVTTSDSEPEPDLAIVRGEPLDYLKHHPLPDDMAMVVEVAETSLRRDRIKCRLYARAGVAVYWIVNLVDAQIEVFTDPSGPAESPSYANQKAYSHGDALPLIVAGQEVATLNVDDLLPGQA